MKAQSPRPLLSYLNHVKTDLSIAAYSKVARTWHDSNFVPVYNKFYFIREGEGFVKLRDRVYYPQPGELYMLSSGVLQSYGTTSENTFAKYWCHFEARVGDLPLFQVLDTPISIQVADPAGLSAHFDRLIELSRQPSLTSGIRAQALLLEIIATYLDGCAYVHTNQAATSSVSRISDVLTYISEHLNENLTVERMAAMAHFHPNYFIPLFKNLTGYPPIQYINRLRMEKAKRLLAQADTRITDIAEQVGMELPYFSRSFKEYAGLSPSVYRGILAGGLTAASSTPHTPQTSGHPRPKV